MYITYKHIKTLFNGKHNTFTNTSIEPVYVELVFKF